MKTATIEEAQAAACCAACGTAATERLVVEQMPYGEGVHLEVEVPLVECDACGLSYTDHRAERLRHAAACRHEGLLAPEEIKEIRKGVLGMSRREFAEAYGLTAASVERWESGRLMQNASLDTLIRALANKATAARLDRRRDRGAGVVGGAERFPALERSPAALEDARQRANGFRLRAVA